MRQEASIKPNRMLWDENREIDLYTWGPLQLFFCVAWAFLDKYRYLSAQHPNLVFADLDRYIEENRAGLDATRDLRDWVLIREVLDNPIVRWRCSSRPVAHRATPIH